jgi:glutamyl-tRNA synthetase
MTNKRMPLTRLAPSPTGALHLGNARTFLINWLLARQNGWKVLLRIEDLDGPRIKTGADAQAIDDLKWLGIDWDEGPVYQTQRQALYQNATIKLLAMGIAYPCICTRKEVESAASAPHAEDGAAIYPGTCQGKYASVDEARSASGREPAIRFAIGERTIEFNDGFRGQVSTDTRTLGDFVIAKGDGTAAYQLSVVVDDAAMNVTHVVRGDDLLDSTPRQIALYEALELTDKLPAYCHLPLVTGTDGRRLAKRHGDTRLSHYRTAGVSAGRMLQMLARWCGIEGIGAIRSAGDLVGRFDIAKMSKQPVVFTEQDDRWLRGA